MSQTSNSDPSIKRKNDLLVDLTNCDREPIHIPGAIQPHGYLAVVDLASLKILQLSINFENVLGLKLSEHLGQHVSTIFAPEMIASLEAYLRIEHLKPLVPLPIKLRKPPENLAVSCLAHRENNFVILEFEPDPVQDSLTNMSTALDLSRRLHIALDSLHTVESLGDVLEICVQEVRNLTGYDRVMVYKFDRDWHGEVLAEAKELGLESYLGLHYPASDIPVQARELYKRNMIRMISDLAYNSVALEPVDNPLTHHPLDMSDCVLRSCSPIHVEYLQNMGVHASLTISLKVRGELWGLIACHHYRPKYLPMWTRSNCEMFGRLVSLRILGILEAQKYKVERDCILIFDEFLSAVRRANGDVKSGFEVAGEKLLTLFNCVGVALVSDFDVVTFGATAHSNKLKKCASWLTSNSSDFYTCNDLTAAAALHSSFFDLGGEYAGLLAIKTGLADNEWMLFFRLRQAQLVTWAGNPTKNFEITDNHLPVFERRLLPRNSFELWREEVKDKSIQWSSSQITMAEYLRSKISELTRRAVHLERAKAEALQRERDEFVSTLAHDLRLPVGGALRMLEFIHAGRLGQRLPQFSDTIALLIESHKELLERIKSILINYQFSESTNRISNEKLDLETLILKAISVTKTAALAVDTTIAENLAAGCLVAGERDALVRVVENLLSNSIKYSPGGSSVTISLVRQEGKALITIADSGIGIEESDIPHLFERFWRVRQTAEKAVGSGLGLFVCKQIVEAHNGEIWCESVLNQGSKFFVSLPLIL